MRSERGGGHLKGATVAMALMLVTTMGSVQAVPGLLSNPDGAGSAEDTGAWQAPFDAEIPAVNMALTPGGEVVYYDGSEANNSHDHAEEDPGPHAHPDAVTFFTREPERSQSRIYDPDSGTIATPSNDPQIDIFCSGTTVRPDGDVMTVGGTEWRLINESGVPILGKPEVLGTDQVYTLSTDGTEGAWESQDELNVRRWYPTVIETADGGALAAAGIKNLSEAYTHNVAFETLEPGSTSWELVEPSFRVAEGVFLDHQGRVGNTELAPANLPMYPKLFVVPSGPHAGEVLYPANGDLWAPFGERPDEALWGTYQFIDPDTGEVTFAGASPFGPRNLGNAVPLMLDPDDGYALEVLSLGGTLERTGVATTTAEIVDASGERVEGTPVEPMTHPRWHPNSVLLPTGDVVTVGGARVDNVLVHGQPNAPVLEAELFDADTREWRTLDSMQLPRAYHSTAILLPSGEILAGGHVPLPVPQPDVREHVPTQDQRVVERFEVFQPPYLFNDEDTRPEIVRVDQEPADPAQEEAVAAVGFDATFTVTVTGLEGPLDDVTLIRPGATTHTVDADQRGIRLQVLDTQPLQQDGKVKLTLKAPPDGAVAPPGHYMLFVNEGTDAGAYPSTAEFVKLGPEAL